jgi:hypothetical protein
MVPHILLLLLNPHIRKTFHSDLLLVLKNLHPHLLVILKTQKNIHPLIAVYKAELGQKHIYI